MKPISPEELELITNPLARPAYFAEKMIPPGPLEIRHRLFGSERGLLREKKIENVKFVQCIFDSLQGYGNDLHDVVFDECNFFSGVLSGSNWRSVLLRRCTAQGHFGILGETGDVTCEDCAFTGLSQREAGLGNWSDHFGFVGSQELSTFVRCKLTNFSAGGSRLLRLVDCQIGDLVGLLDAQQGTLQIERCDAKNGKLEFSGSGNDFARIRIQESQLSTIELIGVSGSSLEVSSSRMNLFLGGTKFRKVDLTNSVFGDREAIDAGIDTVGEMLIDSCRFEGRNASLRLSGQREINPDPGMEPISWSRYGTLTLRNMSVPKAELAYLQVGTLTLENTTLENTDLSHSRIGTLRLKNAKVEGRLDLNETTFRRIENEGLINSAKVIGKLEATPGAPEPEVVDSVQLSTKGKAR